jgi:hypothetical protein
MRCRAFFFMSEEDHTKKKSHKTLGGLFATLACGIVVFVAQWAWGQYWDGVKSVKDAAEDFKSRETELVKRVEELERQNKSLKERLLELKDDHNKDSDEVWTAWGKHQTRMNNLEIKSGVIEGLIESFRLENTVARAIAKHNVTLDPFKDGDGWEGEGSDDNGDDNGDDSGDEGIDLDAKPAIDLPPPPSAPLPPQQQQHDYRELLDRVREVERERENEKDPLEYKRWIQEQRIQQVPNIGNKK